MIKCPEGTGSELSTIPVHLTRIVRSAAFPEVPRTIDLIVNRSIHPPQRRFTLAK